MTTPRVSAGLVAVEAACPRCGTLETIAVRLGAVLTTPDDDAPSLKIQARSKPLHHECDAPAFTLLTAHDT